MAMEHRWIGHVLRHDKFLQEIIEEWLGNISEEGDEVSK